MPPPRSKARSAGKKLKGPSLGIWWDAGGQGLPNVQVALTKAKNHSGYRDSGKLHANEWKRIQKTFPGLMGMQYIDIPRGRVVHSKGRFIVQMGHQSLKKATLRKRIAEAFRLPEDSTAFVHDLEYDLSRYIPEPFSKWLKKQTERLDQVGFFARLAFNHGEFDDLTAAVEDPDKLRYEFRHGRGKVANSVREALEEWKVGKPTPRRR